MSDEPTINLFDHLRDSGLFDPARLEQVAKLPEAADPDPRALGRVLVRRGWLTPFQLRRAAQGRAKELVVGPYVLLDRLGEGGMGEVYRARHRHMQRIVALKLIRKDRLGNEIAVRRFYQEVQLAAQLHHPNIVTAFDAGPAGNSHYFAMELVEGTDLSRLVRESGPLPAGEACEFIRQAALGLEHAREKGLVHRDIKPSNLLASWDANGTPVVKVLDMGLAIVQRTNGRQKGLTQSGVVMGTPDYLAPEQALDSRGVDIRSDLYSLGCTLYFLLAGRAPFAGDSLAKVLVQHQMEEPGPPPGGWESMPEAVQQVLRKLLAKRPEDRYQTPRELAEALEPLCDAAGAAAVPRQTVSKKSERPDTAWSSMSGERTAPGTRASRANSGAATDVLEVVANREAADKRQRRARQLQIGIALGAGLAVALILVLVLVLSQRPRAADVAAVPATQAANASPSAADGGGGRVVPANADVTAPPRAATRRGGAVALERLDPTKAGFPLGVSVPLKLPVVAILPGHADVLTGVTFAPGGGRLATTCRDGTIRLWDLTKSEPLKLLDDHTKSGPAGSPAFSPDGSTLAVASNDGVIIYDVTGAAPVRRADSPACTMTVAPGKTPFPEQILAFLPDGKALLVAHVEPLEKSQDNTLFACVDTWRLEDGETRRVGSSPAQPSSADHPGNDHCVAVAPDLRAARGGEAKSLQSTQLDRFGTATGWAGQSPHADAVVGLAFSPDGSTLVITTGGGVVDAFFDVAKDGSFARLGGGTGRMKGHQGWATPVGFTADGKTFITRGQDRYVAWWNPGEKPPKLREWQTPEGTHLWRFSPDGRYAALSIPGERIALVRLSAPFQLP